MIRPNRFVFAFMYVVFAAVCCRASNIYVAQEAAGGNSGADCANAHSATWFNSSANWTPIVGPIGPGTTVHLCGTFTGLAGGGRYLTFHGSGTSGNPITLIADQGPVTITAPYWSGDIISLGSARYITINGDNNLTLQATANGTNLQYQYQTGSCVSGSGGGNIIVENLTCSNLYVHACTPPISNCRDTNGYGNGIAISSESTVQILNNTIHDLHWAVIYAVGSGSYGGFQASGNNIYNMDHGIVPLIGNGSSGTLSNVFIFGNHIHDMQSWDDVADNFHHDPIHAFDFANGTITGIYVYNNLFDGNWGVHTNSGTYMEGPNEGGVITSCYIFNNVYNPSAGSDASGSIADYSSNGCLAANNTVFSSGIIARFTTSGGAIWYNNIVPGCGNSCPAVMGGNGGSGLIAASDYNAFALLPTNGNGFVQPSGHCCQSLATWQRLGFDTHAVVSPPSGQGTVAYLNFDPLTYALLSKSPLIQTGKNLYSICHGQPVPGLGALCSDYSGNPRSSSGNWDIGAYSHPPAAPSNLTGIVK